MPDRFDGSVEFTSPEPIIRYLVENYTHSVADSQKPITVQEATKVVNSNLDDVRSGIRLKSYAHYTGDQIANKTDWLWIEDEEPLYEEEEEEIGYEGER